MIQEIVTCLYEMARFKKKKKKKELHMHTLEGTSIIIVLEKYIRKPTEAIIANAVGVGMQRKRLNFHLLYFH